jgi:hypothetical protein
MRARGVIIRGLGVLVSLIATRAAAPASAQLPAPTRCAVGIPESEESGYVPLPRGDVFCPLLADPKGQRSFISWLRETSDEGDSEIGSVGISDALGLLRWGGPRPGDGFQISLAGSVFAQFDLDKSSYDLINTDYIIVARSRRASGSTTRARTWETSFSSVRRTRPSSSRTSRTSRRS